MCELCAVFVAAKCACKRTHARAHLRVAAVEVDPTRKLIIAAILSLIRRVGRVKCAGKASHAPAATLCAPAAKGKVGWSMRASNAFLGATAPLTLCKQMNRHSALYAPAVLLNNNATGSQHTACTRLLAC